MSPEDLAEIVVAAGFEPPLCVGLGPQKKAPLNLATGSSGGFATTTVSANADLLQKSNVLNRIFRLPGRPQLEEFFNDYVVDIVLRPEKYAALGITFPSPMVLHGPPGCGKTFAVERLVEFLDWPSYSIDSESVASPYIHDTSKKISEVFTKAIDTAPSVITIDEMESFLTERRAAGTFGLHHVEEVAEFLRRIPEACGKKVLVIGMTNMLDLIDPAVLRRGRFDHLVEVEMPSRAEVVALLDFLLAKLPKSDDLRLEPAIVALTGKPLSDAAFFVREAARLAAKSGKAQLDQESMSLALDRAFRSPKKKDGQIGFLRHD